MKTGDKLLCIDDANIDSRIANKPIEGKEYTVRAVIPNFVKGQQGLLLEEIINEKLPHPSGLGNFEPNFAVRRFIKIDVEPVTRDETEEVCTTTKF